MRSYLPDHSQIYVPLSLRYNYEITHTHHLKLQIIVQKGGTIAAFANVKQQTGATVSRVDGRLARMGFYSIRESFVWWVDIWMLAVTCCTFPWPLTDSYSKQQVRHFHVILLIKKLKLLWYLVYWQNLELGERQIQERLLSFWPCLYGIMFIRLAEVGRHLLRDILWVGL